MKILDPLDRNSCVMAPPPCFDFTYQCNSQSQEIFICCARLSSFIRSTRTVIRFAAKVDRCLKVLLKPEPV
ncbi:hypothetical protein Pla52n_28400 [Stieleria varia]|uniref:Uncharacterized protein n=1 Tax=Stieleria varia TaxID=2528005 RepID=A0A5C6B0I0_9BACT|nr:hypothetical protein Pla52n_28400 [Stieleria varia]